MPDASFAKVPDFTKGEKLEPSNKKLKMQDRTMGPTGLWGQVYSKSMFEGASRDARQWLVTRVDAGSPADGKIQIGDVVIDASGKEFDSDARKLLAAAIHQAEETNGSLSLKVWREGKTFDQSLQLEVMGKFDKANPFNCEYTDSVIDQMARHVLSREDDKGIFMPPMAALGMLATGKEELMPRVRDFAH